jgi:hypothetical protein
MDGQMRPLFPRGGRLHFETQRTRARLTCGCDRVFLVEITIAIDIERDPGALEELSDDGLQRFTCPRCEQAFELAEPILILDRERERMALFVPYAVSHRALAFGAELAGEIARADPATLPPGAIQPALLVGVQSLREWLFGPGGRSRVPSPPKPEPEPAAPGATIDRGLGRRPIDPATPARSGALPIHEAFADLAHSDSRIPSAIPAAPEIDDVDEDEPMFGEDWLARDTLSPPGPGTDPPPRPGQPDAIVPPMEIRATSDPAIDFAELLEEDDLDEDLIVDDEDRDRGFEPDPLIVEDDDDDDSAEVLLEDDGILGNPTAAAPRDLPVPILEGAPRCLDLQEDGVSLSIRLPAARIALFDPSAADLWFQLLQVDGNPLVAITLVSDPTMDRPHWTAWPIDPRRGSDRDIVHALRRSYRADIRLFDAPDHEAACFTLSADRELNVSVVLERASRVLHAAPTSDAELSEALARLSAADQPFGDPLPPLFTSYGLPPMENFDQTAAALAELTCWLEPDRYDHLVLVRSLPLDYLEEIVVEVLDRSVRHGVRLPERLKDRAIALGHAANRGELCRVLVENFDRVMTSDDSPAAETAARNWRDLQTDCAEENVSWDPRIQDQAEELIEAHGLVDEAALREAQAALAEPDGLDTDQLLRMLQHRRLRPKAIIALCQRAEPAAWKDAVRALDRLDPAGVLDAVRVVAGLREAVSGEIAGLLGSERPHVRQAAAALLGGLALRRTLRPVLKALGGEPTSIWPEFARSVAATGSAAVRSIERQLTDEQFPLERLALAVRLLEQDAPRACARFEAMAESGDERAARMLELGRSAACEPSRVSPVERYGELLRRAVAGEAISEKEMASAVEAFRTV